MQVFFRTSNERLVSRQLLDTLTLDDFIKTAGDVLGSTSRHEILSWRYAVGGKPLDVKHASEFDRHRQYITKDCIIFVMGRLLGGSTFPDTLQIIVEQQLEDELDKVATHSTDCSICFDTDTDCLRVCCAWMCREDFKSWLLGKQFKVSCILCSKAIMLKDIFKTPEYIATVEALEDEKQLLRNMDCQRCLDCNALMHNETMWSCQTCAKCLRVFCFFCNRNWNAMTMRNSQNTCGKECVYETMLSFQLVPFHYKKDMEIPSRRTCPRCFNFGSYDGKCKYHACTVCKFTFCFLCLEEEEECKRTHKSSYDHACVRAPIPQTYRMFPQLVSQ
ncbi:hypothetical protein BC939DRAFT_445937 [Gamsiella multidivaricata]|uniref:uncharacterized protein n=1 Tax=Gamsiella multidivaricata TaxID=101098 RepID=UPI002220C8D5|nr:uncharacterized protein BC939DRAFT_445937 [Gamsiella multidivaricata]KAG0364022.1 hypothetical protein BGZ54_007917 [Gamsiella multidivaricata]KAI7827158.1 hypothetical protein BC939DRAFT_445937 [Gamsiella multidivaricata]